MMSSIPGTARLADEIQRRTGRNPARCYQCGKCSAGCPMAAESDLRPHDVLRLISAGRKDDLLNSDALWLCLGCEMCTSRCPNDCDPAGAIDALRAMALEQGASLPRVFDAFHIAFLEEIQAYGRISEFGMIMRYKMRTGALFQDAANAPSMVTRGKLRVAPTKITGVKEVRDLFKACEEETP